MTLLTVSSLMEAIVGALVAAVREITVQGMHVAINVQVHYYYYDGNKYKGRDIHLLLLK